MLPWMLSVEGGRGTSTWVIDSTYFIFFVLKLTNEGVFMYSRVENTVMPLLQGYKLFCNTELPPSVETDKTVYT